MNKFEVVENGMDYEARDLVEGPSGIATAVLFNATLKVGSSKLVVRQGDKALAAMDHNVAQTKFEITGASDEKIAELSFAWVSVKKSFTLTLKGTDYKVEENVTESSWACHDAAGKTLMLIEAEKHFFSADHWRVTFTADIPAELAFLAVVALKQRRA